MAEEKPQDDAQPEQPKGPNFIQKLWKKSKITPFSIMLAMKGGLATTIALAAYEAHGWAETYTTLGYLVAIIAQLSLCIQPRAKFVQSIILNLLFSCVGAASALLLIQCSVAARTAPSSSQTGSSGSAEANTYEAAPNAVAAVFLFVFVFLANVVKAARPQMMIPVVQFSIFTIVASVYAPSFPNMTAGKSFARRLLITFLTGHALATGVSLFVLPVTSRGIVNKQMAGIMKLMTATLASHGTYMRSIKATPDNKPSPEEREAAKKLKGFTVAVQELFGKIRLELGFARKEFAWGKLNAEQYSEIYDMTRDILQPLMGLSTFLQIMKVSWERRAEFSEIPEAAEAMEAMKQLETEEWKAIMDLSREAYEHYQKALFMGLSHISLQLEFEKPPKKATNKSDVEESAGGVPKPGDMNFSDYLAGELHSYQAERNEVIADWAQHKQILLPPRFWSQQLDKPSLQRQETAIQRQNLNQHQLYLVLYLNFLNYCVGQSILKLARWADARHEDGTMKKSRLINPGARRLRRLFQNAFRKSNEDETLTAEVNGGTNVYLGDALRARKDPEHLPPKNVYEKLTDHLRRVPKLLASNAAGFAFRAAMAAMSLAIVGFLRQSRPFFLRQRGVWAMIMTAISMDPHSGPGVFGFGARIIGTIVAMTASIVIWYMCDHNHAGILVVFWIYQGGTFVFLFSKPQYAMVAMLSAVTVILIIGYELQVDILGITVATSNGQEFYPVELLAVYRLAAVSAGMFAAFFWTFFPYPITTHGALRQDVGSTMYILANYYSCVHTTLDARLHLGPAVNDLPPGSPIDKLNKARQKVFGKVLLMLTRLREHQNYTKYEIPFGGRFPKETYGDMIESIRNIFTYLSLITYASRTFTAVAEGEDPEAVEEEKQWLEDFRKFAVDTKVTSHELTTNLCLLSSAIRSGTPLPPYLRSIRPYSLSENMQVVDPDLMGVAHFAHPCYAAFAVGEVASAFITAEMHRLTKLTKQLVGEVDFSFHVVSTMEDGSSTTSTLWEKDPLLKKKGE